MPPISSTSSSAPARISPKSPRLRVSTPLITGMRPLKRSISPARAASSDANAAPTVPWPSRPTRKAAGEPPALADIARREVLERLPPHHHPGVPVPAEDHRGPGDPVVVARHREAVGARGGDDHDVARPGVLQA